MAPVPQGQYAMTVLRQKTERVQTRPLPCRLLAWLLAALASAICSAEVEVYKVVDGSGAVIYTDTPPMDSNASKLALPSINRLPSGAVVMEDAASAEEKLFAGYSRVEISSPGNDSLIYYDQPQVTVRLALTPELQAGHLVQFMLDGYPHGRPVAETDHIIDNLQRGSHSLSARVLNAKGGLVGQSAPVTIHVQRHLKRP